MKIKSVNGILATGLFAIPWVLGMVLAKGFWSTLIAVVIPLWAWYLVAEKYLQTIGWV